jgi:hypothetical protein
MEGVGQLLERYSSLLDEVIESIDASDMEKVSKYILVLQDIITLIAKELEEHPEEKHKYADIVGQIHEKQQKILALLETQANNLLQQVQDTTNTYQARKAYEQNKGLSR